MKERKKDEESMRTLCALIKLLVLTSFIKIRLKFCVVCLGMLFPELKEKTSILSSKT